MIIFQNDVEFFKDGLRKSIDIYEKKQKQSNVFGSNLFVLVWEVNVYEILKVLNMEMSGYC